MGNEICWHNLSFVRYVFLTQKFQSFSVSDASKQFLSTFRTYSWVRTLETFNNEWTRCPVCPLKRYMQFLVLLLFVNKYHPLMRNTVKFIGGIKWSAHFFDLIAYFLKRTHELNVDFYSLSIFSRRFSSEKSPTITVASFFFFFFVKPQTSSCMYHFLAVTGSSPCFSQKLFRSFAKADETEGYSFNIFQHCATFFEFFCLQRVHPSFLKNSLQQTGFSKSRRVPTFAVLKICAVKMANLVNSYLPVLFRIIHE